MRSERAGRWRGGVAARTALHGAEEQRREADGVGELGAVQKLRDARRAVARLGEGRRDVRVVGRVGRIRLEVGLHRDERARHRLALGRHRRCGVARARAAGRLLPLGRRLPVHRQRRGDVGLRQDLREVGVELEQRRQVREDRRRLRRRQQLAQRLPKLLHREGDVAKVVGLGVEQLVEDLVELVVGGGGGGRRRRQRLAVQLLLPVVEQVLHVLQPAQRLVRGRRRLGCGRVQQAVGGAGTSARDGAPRGGERPIDWPPFGRREISVGHLRPATRDR